MGKNHVFFYIKACQHILIETQYMYEPGNEDNMSPLRTASQTR